MYNLLMKIYDVKGDLHDKQKLIEFSFCFFFFTKDISTLKGGELSLVSQ